MVTNWIIDTLKVMGITDFESITLFNLSMSLSSILLIVFICWLILLIADIVRRIHHI